MKQIVIPVAVVVVALAAWGFLGRGRAEKPDYRFVEVTRGAVRSTVSTTGKLQAITTVEVGTQVSGKVTAIYADYNDLVTAGQLIARIDSTLLGQAVRSAGSELARTKAELAQTKRELDRIERLYNRKAATESEYSTAQYQAEVAAAALVSAEVNLERARQNLAYTEIVAPVDGVVLDRTVDVGQTVAASLSAPQLFLIAGDLSAMEILASVDESDIGKIREGQKVEFTVQAWPDEIFTGAVGQVRLQSTLVENVVNYTVAISVVNPEGRLLPAMTATVEVILDEAADVLKVANAALRFRPAGEPDERLRGASGGRTSGAAGRRSGPPAATPAEGETASPGVLWRIDEEGRPVPMRIETGLTDGQFTEVRGPELAEGMQVVASVTSATSTSTTANPFQSGQGSRPPGPPPGL